MKYILKLWIFLTAILALAAMIGAGYFMNFYWQEYHAGEKSYAHIEQVAVQKVPEGEDADLIAEEKPLIDFEALGKINPDVVGWIFVPDTKINYPIVRRENDNDHYLTHLFDGSYNKTGAIFMDTRCSMESQHILIHGHNMGNGSMFRDLNLFKNKDFFLDHPYYLILTPEENYVVEIFAGSVVRLDSPVWELNLKGEEEQQRWLSRCRNEASVSKPFYTDSVKKVVTLSTCTYEFNQARWILQGSLQKADDAAPGVYQELIERLLSSAPAA